MVATESAPVTQQKQRARRVRWGRIEVPWALIVLAVSVLLWQFVVVALHVKEYLVPAPLKVAQELVNHWGMYWHNTLATGAEVLVGFGISLAVALPIALLIAYSRPLSRAIYPLLVVSQTVPKIALAPLFLVWFGFGWTPKVLITVLVAFFPIVVDSVNGFTSAPPEMRDLTRSMGAKRLPNFWKVQLPQALPQIFAGMKIASTLAVIGAVVAEFIGANNGLGYIITLAVNNLQTVEQFAAIVLLSVMGMLFFGALALLERLLLPWHVSVRSRQP
jgi:ABC-type nitrate/sulfonate/bicarbonate transport system permease component